MRIAQIAPLYESVPPKFYGGTERVVSYLTEALVDLGHDVTLFASGDSVTSANLEAAWPRALRLDPTIRDALAPHVLMLEQVRRVAHEFDVLHFHLDYMPFPLFSTLKDTPFVTTLAWPSRPAGIATGVRHVPACAGHFDLRLATSTAAAGELAQHDLSRLARATCSRRKRKRSRNTSLSSGVSARRSESIPRFGLRRKAVCR
jgi:glycosyltransferase involved in cell wall biosynthesis